MRGRELLECGYRWMVSNGKSISIYKDAWISRSNSFKVIYPFVLPPNAQIIDLISETGYWNE